MNFELNVEGFSTDEELKERLLICVRKFLMESAVNIPVRLSVKLIDGYVQCRIDMNLETRKLSAFVRRKDPEQSVRAAVSAMDEALRDLDNNMDMTGTED